MLSVRKLAECANVSPQTIFNYVSNGYLVPSKVTPDGRYFFKERAVGQVLTKKYEKTFRKGILVVQFVGTEDEKQSVENYLKETSLQRCDDIIELIYSMRSQVREEQEYQIECFKYASSEVVRKCKHELEQIQSEYKGNLLSNQDVENIQEVFRRFSEIMGTGKCSNMQVRLSANDEDILSRFANAYMCEMKEITEKYQVNQMGEISKKLTTEPEAVLAYKPEGRVVDRIWQAAEEKYYNSKIDSIVREKLENGYVSYLMLIEGEDNRILKLLEKGMSEGYSRIVVFKGCLATPEEQEVLQFIEERKQVFYMDSEESATWSADGADDTADSNRFTLGYEVETFH